MSEKKRVSKQPKKKKLSKRQVAANEKAAALSELAKQAKTLCKQIKKGDKSTRELGELLLKVKTYGPPRGLKNWIQTNIGADEVTRNRCNYAISLANPNSARNKQKKIQPSAVVFNAIREIRQALPNIEKAVAIGFTREVKHYRAIIIANLDKLVTRAEYMEEKICQKLSLNHYAQSEDPRIRARAETRLVEHFNQRRLLREDGRFVPEDHPEQNEAKPEQAQAAAATS